MARGPKNSETVPFENPSIGSSGVGANQHQGSAVTKDLNTGLRFGFLIHDVSRLRRVVVDRALKPLGITRSQWWVLAFLSRRDGMTQTALAADLDLTKVAIGGLLDRMEAAGFVERRADASDGRARRVYLTRAGSKMVITIRENVEQIELQILENVSEEALNQAAATLVTIKETLLELAGSEGEAIGSDPEFMT
nr:MarR family transcriptional regulator [Sphingopyxis italica]